MTSYSVCCEKWIGGKLVSAVRYCESYSDSVGYGVSIFDVNELEETEFFECRETELKEKYEAVCKRLFEALPY